MSSFNFVFLLVRSRTGMSSLEFCLEFSAQSDEGVLAGILFWVCTERLGCPRFNCLWSLWEATGASSLEFCFELLRSDWGVLAGVLFWVCKKRLGCPLLMSSFSSLCEATMMSLLQFHSHLFFCPFQATGVSGLKFYFLVLFHSTGISSLNFYC